MIIGPTIPPPLGVSRPSRRSRRPEACRDRTARRRPVDPAGLDEQRGDQAPGDEGADVGQDHVGQERAEPLDVDPGPSGRGVRGGHDTFLGRRSGERSGSGDRGRERCDPHHADLWLSLYLPHHGPGQDFKPTCSNPMPHRCARVGLDSSRPTHRGGDTMKALRFYAPEDVRLEDVPEPECGPGEIKLRVRNCSTCGTDVKIFHNGHQNLTPPRTIGHEIAGEVVEVGADVNATYGSTWAVGDRAQVIAAVPCGDCHECRKGWMAVCAEPDLGRLPVRRRLRRVHDRAAAGAQGRRPQQDPRQRRLRRGLGRRAVRLRHQRPGAARHRGGRHRRGLRRGPDRLHAHPHRPRRAPGRPGLPRRRQRRAAEDVGRRRRSPTRPSTAPRSTSSSGSWS